MTFAGAWKRKDKCKEKKQFTELIDIKLCTS